MRNPTQYDGVLTFTGEMTVKQLGYLNSILAADIQHHPEWDNREGLSHVDLMLTEDFSGLVWNGGITYDVDKQINFLIRLMKNHISNFGLCGQLLAQGEDPHDRWLIVFDETGRAERRELVVKGRQVTCPSCQTPFFLEE